LLPLFQQNNVNFSNQAAIALTDTPGAWQILDASPTGPGNYTVWDGYDELGD
jgi:hypothetical protein